VKWSWSDEEKKGRPLCLCDFGVGEVFLLNSRPHMRVGYDSSLRFGDHKEEVKYAAVDLTTGQMLTWTGARTGPMVEMISYTFVVDRK
jgi:hypothetical protein